MNIQNLYEEIRDEFPEVGDSYFIKLFNDAQLKFITDTGVLVKGVAIDTSDLQTSTSFNLPSDFIRLKRVDFLNSNNEVIYEPLMYYCGEDKITFDDTTSTITAIPGEISNIILLYVYEPVTITNIDSNLGITTVSVPTQFIEGVMAWIRRKLYQRYKIEVTDRQGTVRKTSDWNAIQYYTNFYDSEVRKAIKYINSLDTSSFTIAPISFAGDIPQYIVNPPSGNTVSINRSWGTTAQRPTLDADDIGYQYYDTDMDSPVWWNGSSWV